MEVQEIIPTAKRCLNDNPWILAAEFSCPVCKEQICYNQKFCSECGSKFTWEKWEL